MATSAGETAVELEDPLRQSSREWLKPPGYFSFHTSLVVAPTLCWLQVAQTFSLAFGCLNAWYHQENVVIGFTPELSPIPDER